MVHLSLLHHQGPGTGSLSGFTYWTRLKHFNRKQASYLLSLARFLKSYYCFPLLHEQRGKRMASLCHVLGLQTSWLLPNSMSQQNHTLCCFVSFSPTEDMAVHSQLLLLSLLTHLGRLVSNCQLDILFSTWQQNLK